MGYYALLKNKLQFSCISHFSSLSLTRNFNLYEAMETIDTDFVNLIDLVSLAKQYYPTLRWKQKKGWYYLKIGKRLNSYKWEVETRDEFICVLSGLTEGYEIITNKNKL